MKRLKFITVDPADVLSHTSAVDLRMERGDWGLVLIYPHIQTVGKIRLDVGFGEKVEKVRPNNVTHISNVCGRGGVPYSVIASLPKRYVFSDVIKHIRENMTF